MISDQATMDRSSNHEPNNFMKRLKLTLLRAALFALGLLSVRQAGGPWGWPDTAIAGLATTAFLFTLYLTALELFVIHAICRWCVASAAIVTAIAVLALLPIVRRP